MHPWTGRRTALWGGLLFAAAVLAACGDDKTATPAAPPTGTLAGSITVFAASSLTDAFTEASAAFEAANPGTEVRFNFGSSSTLATQINEAGCADVFASANTAQMEVVTHAGHAAGPVPFATNFLVVAKPKGTTVVNSFGDLAKPGVRLVLAAADVPVGQYAREAIKKANDSGAFGADFEAKVLANLKSEEADVRATLAKAELGEADAVIVYATDVLVAEDAVTSLEIPPEYNVVATYPIAPISDSRNAALAAAFVEFVLSEAGRAILAKHSFGAPR
jgi:molybdate transport system substrate-binding protein